MPAGRASTDAFAGESWIAPLCKLINALFISLQSSTSKLLHNSRHLESKSKSTKPVLNPKAHDSDGEGGGPPGVISSAR
jgi:hypothetical protein